MQIERTKNATRNIVWGFLEKFLSVLLPFICRTVLIKTLGAEYLGLSSLFTSILQVLSISELGFGSAIVFSMYKPIAEDDNDTICALLNVYRKIYYVVGGAILVIGLALTPALPHLISGSYPDDINLFILYYIYLFNTAVSYFLYAYKQALFSAFQRNDLISKRTMVINVLMYLFQIGVLFAFRNYYVYAILIPVATLATNLANAYLANKMFPQLNAKGNISAEMSRGIKKRIVGLLSFKIYNVVFASVDSIVISAFLGLTPLAIYNNYFYVQNSIIGFLTIITTSITAGVGNKMVVNDADENYIDFKNFTFLNGWIVSWCAVCLLCLYQHFMLVWVGSSLMFPISTMILMVLYFFLPRVSTLTYTYREAAGLWWEDRFRPLVATAVNLVVNILLVQIIGMNGVIISTLICTIGINIPWGSYILFKNYFKRTPMEYFGQLLFYTVITGIVGGLTYALCTLIPGTGLVFLLSKCVVCLVVPNIGFWLIYKHLPEYKNALVLKDRILRKKKAGG